MTVIIHHDREHKGFVRGYDSRVSTETDLKHFNDVIMGAMASQITSVTIVYSTVYSDTDQRKHQSSASLAFVRGIHRSPVNSRHKGPVMRKVFPFDDVIMEICLPTQPRLIQLTQHVTVMYLSSQTTNFVLYEGNKNRFDNWEPHTISRVWNSKRETGINKMVRVTHIGCKYVSPLTQPRY